MEDLINQRRVRIAANPGQHESIKKSPQQKPFLQDNKLQDWFMRQFSGRMNEEYDDDIEFTTAVAAAAFAIHSLEELNIIKHGHQTNVNTTKHKQPTVTNLGKFTRRFSNKDVKVSGESSMRKSLDEERRELERGYATTKPNDQSFVRSRTPSFRRGNNFETKADAWEKAKMENIRKRHEKMKATIVAWENERKMQAKLKRDRQQRELDKRREQNLQHYQNKIGRIEQIAAGAKAQAEEKIRNKQSMVKDKAKIIRARGQMPVTCFCF